MPMLFRHLISLDLTPLLKHTTTLFALLWKLRPQHSASAFSTAKNVELLGLYPIQNDYISFQYAHEVICGPYSGNGNSSI